MKKNLRALLALALSLLLTLPLAGCGEEPVPEIPDYPVTVSGVSIEKAPRVVGSLSSALTDLLLELGYQRQIIAYSDEDTIPNPLPEEPESEEKDEKQKKIDALYVNVPTEIGQIGTALNPNLEEIGRLMPEVVFTTLPMSTEELRLLNEVNIKVVVCDLSSIGGLKETYRNIILVMEGQNAEAGKANPLIAQYEQDAEEISDSVSSARKKALYFKENLSLIATEDTYEGALLELIADNAAPGMTCYTLEEELIAGMNPDVILYDEGTDLEALKNDERFAEWSAIQNNAFIPVLGKGISQKSFGVLNALKLIRNQMYQNSSSSAPAGEGSSSEPASSGEEGEPAGE